jgi:hypothetical protein
LFYEAVVGGGIARDGPWHRASGADLARGSREEPDVASTGETMPDLPEVTAGRAVAEGTPLRAVTSPQAAEFIGERGGTLYVWVTKAYCCAGAPIRTVHSSTSAPPGVTGFRRFDAGGFQVLLHPSAGSPPPRMDVRLRGRRRPRITIFWDGMPI